MHWELLLGLYGRRQVQYLVCFQIPQKFMCWKQFLDVAVLWGAGGRCLCHGGEALIVFQGTVA